MTAVKLFEYNVPGEIVGKEVIDKNSALVGVCLGMFLDLRTKTVYLIVGGKDYMLKVPMNAVVDVNKEFIRIDMTVYYDSTSAKDIEGLIKLLQQEVSLIARILLINSGRSEKTSQKSLDMLRLFNLI